jgi:replicative DNA helicase
VTTAPPHDHNAEVAVLGAMLIDPEALALASSGLTTDHFHLDHHKLVFEGLARIWAAGQPGDPVVLLDDLKREGTLEGAGGVAQISQLLDAVPSATNVKYHMGVLREKHALRKLLALSQGIALSIERGKARPVDIIDRAMERLAEASQLARPQNHLSRSQIVVQERDRMLRTEGTGIRLEWDKVNDLVGDLQPGDTIGIPGYSNSGKTLWVANIVDYELSQGAPCILAPTESSAGFLSRVAARRARVDQTLPERGSWHLGTQEQKDAYDFALSQLQHEPWSLIPNRSLSPQELMAQVSVRRRQYEGRTVIVVIDHMHRLDYGRENPSFAVPEWTKRLRNWAGEDRMGGMILMLLYQPKKPEVDIQVYKPVTGYGIAGTGQIMAELDIILSPYRRWVKIAPGSEYTPALQTPWGTPRALFESGHPVVAKPESEGAKLDDEHAYLKISKRRTGGEGPTVMLHIDAPCGRIYEVQRPTLKLMKGGA